MKVERTIFCKKIFLQNNIFYDIDTKVEYVSL